MFVRRLLVSAVLAGLAACTTSALPQVDTKPDLKQSTNIGNVQALDYQMIPQRSDKPFSVTPSNLNATDTALCLKQRLSSEFKLPDEFIGHKVYTDNNHSVGLVNPFTKTEGITMDVVGKGSFSEIRLYDNGNLLSRAWKQLPSKCGQGKTTTLAVNSKKPISSQLAASSTPKIDFVSASKPITETVITQSSPVVLSSMATRPTPASPPVVASVATTPVAVASTPSQPNVTVDTPESLPTSESPAQWLHGDLTQDDMSIIAPATAAIITPMMAKAAYDAKPRATPLTALVASTPTRTSSATPSRNTSQAKVAKADASPQERPSNTSKAVASSKANSSKTASSKATAKTTDNDNKPKASGKNQPNKAKNPTTNKVENSKNGKATADKSVSSKNNKAKTQEVKTDAKPNSKLKNNKADTKINKTDKAANKNKAQNDQNSERNRKTGNAAKEKADPKSTTSTKSNKSKAPERNAKDKEKTNTNKGKTSDKKTENNKTSNKSSKPKGKS